MDESRAESRLRRIRGNFEKINSPAHVGTVEFMLAKARRYAKIRVSNSIYEEYILIFCVVCAICRQSKKDAEIFSGLFYGMKKTAGVAGSFNNYLFLFKKSGTLILSKLLFPMGLLLVKISSLEDDEVPE